jgi:hypothetical protein
MSDSLYPKSIGHGGGKRTRKHHGTAHHEGACGITFHGLHNWYISKFEKLGWMVLAQERGHHDKIACYKKSIQRLKKELEAKMETIENHDKKTDLKLMHHNICVLMEHANKDFK